MQLRKLQLTGGSSYTVTLPKDWIDRCELKAGDAVGFSPQADGSIALYAHAIYSAKQARHEVELANDDADADFRAIVSAYLNGFDVIEVRSKKPLSSAARRAVRQASKRIVGLQVVEEDANGIVLQDFMDPKEFHIDKGLRRMQAIARSMQEDALRGFNEEVDVESFDERDDEVDSLYWVINKQYHALLRDPSYVQKLELTPSQALNYLLVARVVERTADHAMRLARNVEAMKGDEIQQKLLHKIEKQARESVQLFADALQAFHRKDSTAANALIADAAEFARRQDALTKETLSLGGESILHVAIALESLGRTAAYAADVAETAINHRVAMGG